MKKQGSFTVSFVSTLYWILFAVGLYFGYMNVLPYKSAVEALTTGGISILTFLQNIPIIGVLFGLLSLGINWILGFLLWAALQTIQLFPIVLRRDKRFMRAIITAADSHNKYQIRDTDDPTLKMLKRWYNNFPVLTISRARFAALFAYAIDFCVCIIVYPPVNGNFNRLWFILTTGQISKINWNNIVLLLLTIFVVELIVRLLFWLNQVKYYLMFAKQEA
ncbi:hypothetical protein H6G80_28505 [Nostoc sp. FACHB-87]|uniref:hypothetical protein n=1 Tax=Nostocaceae TaxID=1162 RepID=UPI001682F24A|nr:MULTISPECIES: hypothetical protein [Nostocaceae]MBD2457994.1 hypothetical protein [Nostoc sp. FACHB-87]MBD2479229.1 hypothetical protein [Anabaena sp. FACHB-83]